jgi:pimeloyl-ACP methyl ester carboxylesterase/predicted glycosyltransferase
MRAKLPAQEGFVDRDGVKLHYEVYGEGPETMVFLPPWSIVHSRIYKAQLPYFSERFRCIAYDARGNGKSDRPTDAAAYSLDQYIADALAVMDATDTGKAILVGLSLGGMHACVLAAHHADRVKAAVLVGTVATIGTGYPRMTPQHFLAKRETFQGWDKYNRDYWLANYPDFAEHFIRNICSEPHSTKQIEDGLEWANSTTGPVLVKTVEARTIPPPFDVGEAMYRKIRCPTLAIHGDDDQIQPYSRAQLVAEILGAELVTIPGGGHNPLGRFPAKCNTVIVDFLDRKLGITPPKKKQLKPTRKGKKALYLSSPIGLGHGRRDLAITRELRKLHPDLEVDWLAQDPVTRLLEANGERIHPLSARLASETRHIELESGEHDLHCFQALRRMDEVLIANFMIFQDIVDEGGYDLVIADEAWDIDHYWHEHPELKKAKLAWFTDFVGFVPMPAGDNEALLTTDYNAEMIEHIERHPGVRDRAIFVGSPEDIVPMSFGKDLPAMRDWVPRHFEFAGYIIGEHPRTFGSRTDLRRNLGYRPDERVCIVTVGGSGVGTHLIKRILQSYPMARARLPELRMIVVTGPRIDPASLNAPAGVEVRAFVPNLDRHLAACDLALVQGGLTTCMELAAAGTPFLYFPLKNHFEQNFHVAHRLDRYRAGRRLEFATCTPDILADAMVGALTTPTMFAAVEADGAVCAARMLADLI